MAKVVVSSSHEDYLEAILHIEREQGAARAKEISKRLNVTYSAVTKALKSLAEKKLVLYEPYGLARLTPKGKKLAAEVVRRHEALKNFLITVLHIDPSEADEEACKLEHAASKNVVDRIIKFVNYVETCPHASVEWLESFGYQCTDLTKRENCPHCNRDSLTDIKIQSPKNSS